MLDSGGRLRPWSRLLEERGAQLRPRARTGRGVEALYAGPGWEGVGVGVRRAAGEPGWLLGEGD